MNTQTLSPSGETWCYVHAELPGRDSPVLVGKLLKDDDRKATYFQYARSYIEDPEAPPIDPINAPKIQGAKYSWPITREHSGIPGCISDAGAVDDFSKRAQLIMQHALAPDRPPITDIDYLILASSEGVGNLFFSQQRTLKERPKLVTRPFENAEDIMEVALDIDEGKDITPEKAIFFKEGSGTGGSRPKTQIREGNKVYIAKFPRPNDPFNDTVAEYVSLKMARKAGIDTANAKLLSTVKGDVLLVERFDIDEAGHRKQLISAHSLSNIYSLRESNHENSSYPAIVRLAEQVKPGCNKDKIISKKMFRRLMFNVCIGNTDDHMRNHAFLNGELSPCYDVNSNLRVGSHSIAISQFGTSVTQDNLELSAKEMGLDAHEAQEVLKDVLDATENWQDEMRSAGMLDRDINQLKHCYSQREKVQRYLDTLTSAEKQRERYKGISR